MANSSYTARADASSPPCSGACPASQPRRRGIVRPFDALAIAGRDLRGLPYRRRRTRLRRLLGDAAPPLALMPATRELAGAQAWMHDHTPAGVEGVVVKHPEHAYRPLRCSWKVRTHITADAVSAA